ncbi:ABC transporter ATP-binding protein [Methylobacterium sp. 174MFSha1.1]|uniref:ABC transporter ATP-binding protein n=1 Tax=Methylobacterium sp. 174MFSha1.1 TaxID=1502749 RepID=UPI0015A5ED3F|nr:ABC transporter ATP-binding protein [Methylobacterium sp. 174MFSha1.1]
MRRLAAAWAGGGRPAAIRAQLREALALLRDAIGDRRGRFGLIVAMAVAAAALEGAALVVLPALLDPGRLAAERPGLAALYLLLVGLAALLLYGQTVASSALTLDFGNRLRLRLHSDALRAGWGTEAVRRPADLVHALTAEAGQSAFATQIAINLAARLIHLPLLLAATLALSPGLAAVAVVLLALAGLPMLPLARRAATLAATMARLARQHHAELADAFAGLKVIKVLQAEARRQEALRARLDEVRAAQLAQSRALATAKAGQRFAAAAAAAAGAVYGLSVLRLDAAAMLALALALVRLASTLAQALDLWRQLGRLLPVYTQFRASEARCRAARETASVEPVTSEPATLNPTSTAPAPRLRQHLELCGVAFTHPGGEAPVLRGVDLVLPARSLTVLSGPSGAGKSTLADLVMGLTAPEAGRILIDGAPLDAACRAGWRARVAYVDQEPFLFHDTIRANLLLARPGATEEEIHHALDEAAAEFVRQLPQGLDTVVGERGGRLSGGQRQRLMLARAFLRRPDLLVLDEATAALDRDSEGRVVASLRRLSRQTTILAIAHRSALFAAADRILHLEDGTVGLRAGPGAALLDRSPLPPHESPLP